MIASAWNNGDRKASGSGYGLRLSSADINVHFSKSFQTISLLIPSDNDMLVALVNIGKKTFWDGTCGELIQIEIGKWLIRSGFAMWPKGHPPKVSIVCISEAEFRIEGFIVE